jgi:hypothetical protein
MCTNEQLVANISSKQPEYCHDLTVGAGLGSKKATVEYIPGACVPQGGDPTGKVEMEKPITFCCLA